MEEVQSSAGYPADTTRLPTEDRAVEAERERNELLNKLIDLTPGGSEFAGDAERCIEWVKGRLDERGKLAAQNRKGRELLEWVGRALKAHTPLIYDELIGDIERFLSPEDPEQQCEDYYANGGAG